MPGERIAKHLSERALTPPATTLTPATTFATLCSSDAVSWPGAYDLYDRPELLPDSKDNLHIILSRFFQGAKNKIEIYIVIFVYKSF